MMGAVPGQSSQPYSPCTPVNEELFDAMFANPVSMNSDAAGSASSLQPATQQPGDELPVHELSPERSCEPAGGSMPSQVEPEIPKSVEASEPSFPEESAALAEVPVAQHQHDASDSVSPVSAPALKGPTGPRGPNVNSSPTSLAEISPPGCRITLNCSLVSIMRFFFQLF